MSEDTALQDTNQFLRITSILLGTASYLDRNPGIVRWQCRCIGVDHVFRPLIRTRRHPLPTPAGVFHRLKQTLQVNKLQDAIQTQHALDEHPTVRQLPVRVDSWSATLIRRGSETTQYRILLIHASPPYRSIRHWILISCPVHRRNSNVGK